MYKKTIKDGKIIVLDIETAGTGENIEKANDLIVEIGITAINLFTGERKIIYDKIVNEGIAEAHRNSWVFQKTNLTFDEVKNAEPLEFEIIQKLLSMYFCTAFNKSFDFDFFKRRGFNINELDCLMLLAEPICKIPAKNEYYRSLGQLKWPSVEECWIMFLESKYGVYVEKHRAGDDSYHEALIAKWLYDEGALYIGENNA